MAGIHPHETAAESISLRLYLLLEGAMKNLLLGLGVIGLIPAGWFLYKYLYTLPPDRTNLALGGAFTAVALICLAVFFFLKFKEEGDQDISITKL